MTGIRSYLEQSSLARTLWRRIRIPWYYAAYLLDFRRFSQMLAAQEEKICAGRIVSPVCLTVRLPPDLIIIMSTIPPGLLAALPQIRLTSITTSAHRFTLLPLFQHLCR